MEPLRTELWWLEPLPRPPRDDLRWCAWYDLELECPGGAGEGGECGKEDRVVEAAGRRLAAFEALRAVLAPVVETLLLTDQLLFMQALLTMAVRSMALLTMAVLILTMAVLTMAVLL